MLPDAINEAVVQLRDDTLRLQAGQYAINIALQER